MHFHLHNTPFIQKMQNFFSTKFYQTDKGKHVEHTGVHYENSHAIQIEFKFEFGFEFRNALQASQQTYRTNEMPKLHAITTVNSFV